MSDKPIIAEKRAIAVDLEEGKTYYWCTCGRSAKQPFCDGSHKVCGASPLKYTATETGRKFLCQCKATTNAPFCDGSHKGLTDCKVGDEVK